MIKTTGLYLKKKIPEISRLDLSISAGEAYVLLSSDDRASHHLIDILCGLESGFQGNVRIDDIDISESPQTPGKHMFYLSCGRNWPSDMKVGPVIDFFQKKSHVPEDEFEELYVKSNMEHLHRTKISELGEVEWRRFLFLLAQLKGCKNYIIHDFVKGMPFDFTIEFKKSIKQMKEKGCSILYLSNDVFFAPEIGDSVGFMKKGKLLLELKGSRMKKMSLKELYFQFMVER
ncbi:MAG: hypothetical protein GY765_27875 [bacterium]|nr:hypothetical protein [bacterium]